MNLARQNTKLARYKNMNLARHYRNLSWHKYINLARQHGRKYINLARHKYMNLAWDYCTVIQKDLCFSQLIFWCEGSLRQH